jgi:predicted transcriptional regulator
MRARTVDVDKLKQMYERGLSQTFIARVLNIHRTSVGYYLDILGISRSTVRNYEAWQKKVKRARMFEANERRRAKQTDEIIRLYTEEKLWMAEISRMVGVDRRTVYRVLSPRGLLRAKTPAKQPAPPKAKAEPKPYIPPADLAEPPELVEKLLSLASPKKARTAA